MIFLGLGSNLSSSFGDRFKNIDLTISYLEKYKIKLLKKSSYYETPSYPNNNHPKFINVVIQVSSNVKLNNLIPSIIEIENKLERKRIIKNEPRTCDIDILDYNSQVIKFNYENLTFVLPHDQICNRNFVLIPLKEIYSNWRHPKCNKSVSYLINNLSEKNKNSILKVKKP